VTDRPEDKEQSDRRRTSRRAGLAYQGTIEAVFSVLVGAGIGCAADVYFDTTPWCMLGGLLMGFGAFVLRLSRLARQLGRQGDNSEQTNDREET
jgi:F0F1-type ATP synthase assembly protein I